MPAFCAQIARFASKYQYERVSIQNVPTYLAIAQSADLRITKIGFVYQLSFQSPR